MTTSQNSNQDSKIEAIVSSPIQQVIAQAQEQAVDGTTTFVLLTIDGSLSGYDGAPLVIENSPHESNPLVSAPTSNENNASQTLYLDTSSADIENLFLINSTPSNDDIS